MKIGVQGLFLNQPFTGIGQYTKNLLMALSQVDKINQYVVVVPEKIDLSLGSNFRFEVLPYSKKIVSKSMKKLWWEQIQVQEFFKKQNVDLIFFPYPANSWTKPKTQTVVAVHDTIPWDRKEYAPTLLSRLKHTQSKKALKKASALVCVSQATKDDLLRHLPSLKTKAIKVIHNGVSPLFKTHLTSEKIASILKSYKLHDEKYFLYVGGYDERKNVKTVVNAFIENVAPFHDVKMVFVGDKAHFSKLYKSLDRLKDIIQNDVIQKMPGKVMLTGFIKEEELSALYSGSLSLINTSLQEGFNLPVVEAASLHVPVICSDIAIHREVLGEYPAEYVSANSVEVLGTLMQKMATDNDFYQNMLESCKRCTIDYNWQQTAKDLLNFYELAPDYHIDS